MGAERRMYLPLAALVVLGTVARQGKFREALAQFERSLELEPTNPMTRADYAELVRAVRGAENAARLKAGPAR